MGSNTRLHTARRGAGVKKKKKKKIVIDLFSMFAKFLNTVVFFFLRTEPFSSRSFRGINTKLRNNWSRDGIAVIVLLYVLYIVFPNFVRPFLP